MKKIIYFPGLVIILSFLISACASSSGAGAGTSSSASSVPEYTVTYNANGAASGSVPVDPEAYASGATVTVLGNTGNLAITGYAFTGWNTKANGSGISYLASKSKAKKPGATMPVGATFVMGPANVTLYAMWSPTRTVTYNANGAASGSVPLD